MGFGVAQMPNHDRIHQNLASLRVTIICCPVGLKGISFFGDKQDFGESYERKYIRAFL
jgi:hypothetical protein